MIQLFALGSAEFERFADTPPPTPPLNSERTTYIAHENENTLL